MPDAEYNVAKGKRNSFEITLELHDQEFLLWSGIKNTPRRNKFPDAELIKEKLDKFFDLELVSVEMSDPAN